MFGFRICPLSRRRGPVLPGEDSSLAPSLSTLSALDDTFVCESVSSMCVSAHFTPENSVDPISHF